MKYPKRIYIDPFILLILGTILIAWLFPNAGSENDWFKPARWANNAVCIVFVLYGIRLNLNTLKADLKNYKLHLVIQATTFVIFPLILWTIMPKHGNDWLWLGVFFVGALPSTVSSSVVMVAIAKGNVGAAIFNASISSLLGLAFTPLLMSIYLSTDMGAMPLDDVVLKLLFQVAVPIGVGMMLHKWCGEWASRNRGILRWVDQTVILAIVWTAFCEGFESGIFRSVSLEVLLWLILLMTGLFGVVYGVIYGLCKMLNFERGDMITALFCGSKKSLVHGTVMSRVLVADVAAVGVFILPIMVYHAVQLIIVSPIAGIMGKKG